MKKIITIAIVIISMVLVLMACTTNFVFGLNNVTVEDLIMTFYPVTPKGTVSREIYKYGFDYDTLERYSNLACVRRGGSFLSTKYSRLNHYGPDYLHRLTMRVEINGENAKFYAEAGYWLNVDEDPNNDVEVGTLIYESNCRENNIMAAACNNISDNPQSPKYLQWQMWWYWDRWLEGTTEGKATNIIIDEGRNWNGHGDWIDRLRLEDGTILDLTYSKGYNVQVAEDRRSGERLRLGERE